MALQNPQVKKIEEDGIYRCDYCRKSETNELEWGGMFQYEEITVHYFCLLFSEDLKQNGEDEEGIFGFMPSDIRTHLKTSYKKMCKYCKYDRASVQCCVRKCTSNFHFSCGFKNGALSQFRGNFDSYCDVHRTDPDTKDDNSTDFQCIICFLDVRAEERNVWSSCCKMRVFHWKCVQNYAHSAGYHHFKCPNCNSKSRFRALMQRAGVYVPERDAAWEADPNAFADLRFVYSKCDAKTCLCPHGREFLRAEWRLCRCKGCGGSAIHAKCQPDQSIARWLCPDCAPILESTAIESKVKGMDVDSDLSDLSDEAYNDAIPSSQSSSGRDSPTSSSESSCSGNPRRRLRRQNCPDFKVGERSPSPELSQDIQAKMKSSVLQFKLKLQEEKSGEDGDIESSNEDTAGTSSGYIKASSSGSRISAELREKFDLVTKKLRETIMQRQFDDEGLAYWDEDSDDDSDGDQDIQSVMPSVAKISTSLGEAKKVQKKRTRSGDSQFEGTVGTQMASGIKMGEASLTKRPCHLQASSSYTAGADRDSDDDVIIVHDTNESPEIITLDD